MRSRNSVGGQRIRPCSPLLEEIHNVGRAIVGEFREGMDRLNRERELTMEEQHLVDNLPPNNALARKYATLNSASQILWELALDKQQQRNLGNDGGVYTMEQLGQRLNVAANRWQQFKRELNEQA